MFRFLLLFTSICLLVSKGYAQRIKSSSSLALWSAGEHLYEQGDTVGGNKKFLAAIDNDHRSGNLFHEAESWVHLGDIFRNYPGQQGLEKSISSYNKALAIYKKLNRRLEIAGTLSLKGISEFELGRNDSAITSLSQAERLYVASDTVSGRFNYQRTLADLYWRKGNTEQSLFYYYQGLRTAQVENNEVEIAITSNELATQYFNLHMFDKAMVHLQRAYAVFKKNKDPNNFHTALMNIIYTRVKIGRTAGLLQFLKREEQAFRPTNDHQRIVLYDAYGIAYNATGNYPLAERSFLNMMEKFDIVYHNNGYGSNGNVFYRSFGRTIGNFYIQHHQFEKARPYFEKILLMSKNFITPNTESEVHMALFKIDSASAQYISAIRHYQVNRRIQDSIFNAQSDKEVSKLNIKYETNQRLKDIRLLQNQRDAEKTAAERAYLIRNITFGGIAAAIIIAGLAIIGFRNKQRSNRKLEAHQLEINRQNGSLKNLVDEKDILLADKEYLLNEKDWLLKEVHHRVKNNLQIVISLLNSQSIYLQDPDARHALKESQNRIFSISLIHQKLYQDENLSGIQIRPYIKELTSHLAHSFGLSNKLTIEMETDDILMDVSEAVPLGLILNEGLTNAMKYAFPKNEKGLIRILLKEEADDMLLFELADNGIGLPGDFNIENSKTLGMVLIKGLSEQLGAEFILEHWSGLKYRLKWKKSKLQLHPRSDLSLHD